MSTENTRMPYSPRGMLSGLCLVRGSIAVVSVGEFNISFRTLAGLTGTAGRSALIQLAELDKLKEECFHSLYHRPGGADIVQ